MLVCYHHSTRPGRPWVTVALPCIAPETAAALVDGPSASTWMVPGTWPVEG